MASFGVWDSVRSAPSVLGSIGAGPVRSACGRSASPDVKERRGAARLDHHRDGIGSRPAIPSGKSPNLGPHPRSVAEM
jgi:hypothetical protein